ncbi:MULTISPECIES: asparagine--tRNA ligase [Dictyoglomus]|jgi:asparaginyl-tRNA synthetase|uniref:Asparagine--tRNA ligase n=1 Tax=Dictyoglomus turgidum (strain DSM 6724 / Z-1310) TaxID=515635 RepID=B8E184_DICTD|nr:MULTISPECIES: asparagine--tRNA ligase [Dictyoglomus]ACK42212.1 asparaginyl-tRNA synthetase [Dictyoglomus turgidum DSM 6724]PNV79855.1 MAG: asparagine--tRNA ligase [Dictyoglomus turgidum]HBU32442.1 asparagine--tRNA ligase [Dictyoglomus sp.]
MAASWVYIEDIPRIQEGEVEIRGWLFNKRSSGKIVFLIIRDGTGYIQGVATLDNFTEEELDSFEKIPIESSLIVVGDLRREPRAPGGYELLLKRVNIVSYSEDYPIQKKDHSVDFLLERRHLWIRSRKQNAILRIRSEVVKAIRDFLDEKGFVLIDAPILTPSSCEGTTTLFSLDYFDLGKAYLSQSGQLYMEAACMAFGKVYCFGPAFRAEKSKTRRHLTEFWMVEPEMAFWDWQDNMKLQEELVSYIVQRVLEKRKRELEILERDTKPLEKVVPPFPRITYREAIEILKRNGQDIEYGDDFGGDEETIISNQFDKPVFIHHYPAKIKPFYMQPDPENPNEVLNNDLLAPEGYGEIIGGSQRIHDLKLLEKKLEEYNLPREVFEWYLDLRRYGSVPHSGFGLGIERTVAWICGLKHVREAIPFPRMIYRIYP